MKVRSEELGAKIGTLIGLLIFNLAIFLSGLILYRLEPYLESNIFLFLLHAS